MSATLDMATLYDCRDAFAETLLELVREDPRVIVVVNDSVGSTKVSIVRKEFPDRVINVGIAEQDLVGVGAGLANGGRIPFVCAASPFLTGRALEQIKVDAAYSRANVKLVGVSSGVAYGELGPTHHSIEDVAWTRAIADLTVVVPADPIDTAAAIRLAHATPGPVFVRTSRMPVPAVHAPGYELRFGRAATLRQGTDVTLIANGVMVHRALAAADLLDGEGVSARVLDMATASPIDVEAIVDAARATGGIVTAEEHTVRGGLGGAVAEVVVTHHPVPMRILGFPGFAPTGSAEFLLDHAGLSAPAIRDAALAIVRG
jgi:transketolase